MTSRLFKPHVLPPQLTMDEYVAFIEASLRDITSEQVAHQKALEERDVARFSLSDEPAPLSSKPLADSKRRKA